MHAIWYKSYNLGKGMGKSSFGKLKGKLMGLNYIKQLINSEDMTSQTDNHLGNLWCDSHCSIVLHTFSKLHNFLISSPILLKLFLIGLSDFFDFIESKLFFESTCPLTTVNTQLPESNKEWNGTKCDQIHCHTVD